MFDGTIYSYVCKNVTKVKELSIAMEVLMDLSFELMEKLVKDLDAHSAVDIGGGEVHDMRGVFESDFNTMNKLTAVHLAIKVISEKQVKLAHDEAENLYKLITDVHRPEKSVGVKNKG